MKLRSLFLSCLVFFALCVPAVAAPSPTGLLNGCGIPVSAVATSGPPFAAIPATACQKLEGKNPHVVAAVSCPNLEAMYFFDSAIVVNCVYLSSDGTQLIISGSGLSTVSLGLVYSQTTNATFFMLSGECSACISVTDTKIVLSTQALRDLGVYEVEFTMLLDTQNHGLVAYGYGVLSL